MGKQAGRQMKSEETGDKRCQTSNLRQGSTKPHDHKTLNPTQTCLVGGPAAAEGGDSPLGREDDGKGGGGGGGRGGRNGGGYSDKGTHLCDGTGTDV